MAIGLGVPCLSILQTNGQSCIIVKNNIKKGHRDYVHFVHGQIRHFHIYEDSRDGYRNTLIYLVLNYYK